MLNKLQAFIQRYQMLQPGDQVTCAVSGGADSIALLFAMFLLSEKLEIRVSAAHFNHHLRGEESNRDADFVKKFCMQYEIPLFFGDGEIVPGKKGLEAAARDARYGFLKTLPGKIATAHTADDNAETVLMHMVRGTGLKGLGAISPVNGQLIRPMLNVTRQDVMAFIDEYHLQYVQDSSNDTDVFLRNRLRHHVMPLLKQENPRVVENLSSMALRLRDDEQVLMSMVQSAQMTDVETLRMMPVALRSRVLSKFLEECGVREPESEHIVLVEKLVFSDKPSGKVDLPGNITISRNYQKLERYTQTCALEAVKLTCPGKITLAEQGVVVTAKPADTLIDTRDCFVVKANGSMYVRSRLAGDTMRCSGGTKQLKKLFIDRKIPAAERMLIPVVADESGVLGVYGFGANKERLADGLPAVEIRFEKL